MCTQASPEVVIPVLRCSALSCLQSRQHPSPALGFMLQVGFLLYLLDIMGLLMLSYKPARQTPHACLTTTMCTSGGSSVLSKGGQDDSRM